MIRFENAGLQNTSLTERMPKAERMRGKTWERFRSPAKKIFWFFLVTMVICIAFSVTVTASEQIAREKLRAYEKAQEKQLVKDVRAYLNANGFTNSGVMLTKTTFGDGSVEYRLTVHHHIIDRMTGAEREGLRAELAEFTFPGENYTFVPEFYLDK